MPEAIELEEAYRNTHRPTVNLWYEADEVLKKVSRRPIFFLEMC